MTQYIDKDTLIAEIKRRIILLENKSDGIISMLASGMVVNEYKDLLSFINTLETKEVDLDELLLNLDKDIKEFVTTEEFEKDSTVYGHYWAIAKHAFELGIQML